MAFVNNYGCVTMTVFANDRSGVRFLSQRQSSSSSSSSPATASASHSQNNRRLKQRNTPLETCLLGKNESIGTDILLHCIVSVHLYCATHSAASVSGDPSARDPEKIRLSLSRERKKRSNENVVGGSCFHRKRTIKATARDSL